jgi:hypothetical protein
MGLSNNVILGYMHRTGLALERAAPVKISSPRRHRREPAAPPPQTEARNLTLMQLGHRHCRYIIGDDLYCGADVVPGKPYCPRHRALTIGRET